MRKQSFILFEEAQLFISCTKCHIFAFVVQ